MILSASVTIEARERATSAGADDFVSKPFDAASLIQQVDRLGQRVANHKKTPSRSPTSSLRPPRSTAHSITSDPIPAGRQPAINTELLEAARLAQLEDIARDSSFLSELIAGFITDVDEILAKTQRAVVRNVVQEIPDLMHTLKGAAVGVGATSLAKMATELDHQANEMAPEDMKRRVREIHSCFEATAASLQEYLKSQSHA
jgi:HPt (histidine-containing phosphotransfer) domain-containing protein